MPNGSDTTVAHSAMRSDSRTAVHSSGVSSSMRLRRRLAQDREAVALEYGLGRGRAQEAEVAFGLRLRRGGRRERIDDRRMRVRREAADDLHARLDLGVGLVDDAERRLAARD